MVMTHDAALAYVRDTLRGQEITSGMNGRPVPSIVVVSREALAALVDGDWTLRPLGVIEAEAKRERAGDGVDRTAPQQQGTDARSVTSENGSVGHHSPSTATGPAPIPCAECGVALFDYEIARIDESKGTKFEQLCTECCYLALGLR